MKVEKNEVKVVLASKAQVAEYVKARKAEATGYGAFVAAITTIASNLYGNTPISVATFAASVGQDLGVGKDVSAEDKAERNRIRARIRYALNEAGMLEEKARSPQQGKKGKPATKDKPEAGAEAAEAAATVKATALKPFEAITQLLDQVTDRATMERIANAVAVRLAGLAKDAKPEAPKKRVSKKA